MSKERKPIIRAVIPSTCGKPALPSIFPESWVDLNENQTMIEFSPEQEDLLRIAYQNHSGTNNVSASYKAGIWDALDILGIEIMGINK
jgi:hypothetical protein